MIKLKSFLIIFRPSITLVSETLQRITMLDNYNHAGFGLL